MCLQTEKSVSVGGNHFRLYYDRFAHALFDSPGICWSVRVCIVNTFLDLAFILNMHIL